MWANCSTVAGLSARRDGGLRWLPAGDLLNASRSEQEAVRAASQKLGLPTVLAAMQIRIQTQSRLARSMSPRTLAELALVRICALEDLQRIAGTDWFRSKLAV